MYSFVWCLLCAYRVFNFVLVFLFVQSQFESYGMVGASHGAANDQHSSMSGMDHGNDMHQNTHFGHPAHAEGHSMSTHHSQPPTDGAAHHQADGHAMQDKTKPHHRDMNNENVASRYGSSFPVQPGYGNAPQYGSSAPAQYAPQQQSHYGQEQHYSTQQPQYAPQQQYGQPHHHQQQQYAQHPQYAPQQQYGQPHQHAPQQQYAPQQAPQQQYAPQNQPAAQPQYLQPHPAPQPQYAAQSQYLAPPQQTPQPQYLPQVQYAPQPQYISPCAAAALAYANQAPVYQQQQQTLSYPSPTPQVPCGSNLIFGCAPQVQQVPCSSSYGSYGSYGQAPLAIPTLPPNGYPSYRAADASTLGMPSSVGATHSTAHNATILGVSNANSTSSNTTAATKTTSTPSTATISTTNQHTVGDAQKEMTFNADKMDTTKSDAKPSGAAADDSERKDKHKQPILITQVPSPVILPHPNIIHHHQPQHMPNQVPAYRDAGGNTLQMTQNSAIPNHANADKAGSYWWAIVRVTVNCLFPCGLLPLVKHRWSWNMLAEIVIYLIEIKSQW